MPLPRPARLLRQRHIIPKHTSTRFIHATAPSLTPETAQVEEGESAGSELVDFGVTSRSSRKQRHFAHIPQNVVDSELNTISAKIGDTDLPYNPGARTPFGRRKEEEEYDDDVIEFKEPRRSPAALLGSKKLELTSLPEELVRGIEDAMEGESAPSSSRLYVSESHNRLTM